MSYENITALTINTKKEEIAVTSYSSNVSPKTPERWIMRKSGDFREDIKNLLNAYFGGSFKILTSTKSQSVFALRAAKIYYEQLTGYKLRFADLDHYYYVQKLEYTLENEIDDIAYKTKRELNREERIDLVKNLNNYKELEEKTIKMHEVYDKVQDKLVDFVLKIVNKDYDKELQKKNFLMTYQGRGINFKLYKYTYAYNYTEKPKLLRDFFGTTENILETYTIKVDTGEEYTNLEIVNKIDKQTLKEEFEKAHKELVEARLKVSKELEWVFYI